MSDAATSARVTFRGNLERSRHGWLRLTPAYSVQLVEELVAELPKRARVLDPFCGSGTTLVTCAERGLRCTTVDLNPFLVWLANAKAANYSSSDRTHARRLVERMAHAGARTSARQVWLPPISNIDRWWDCDTQLALGRAFASVQRSASQQSTRDLALVSFCRAMIASAKVSFGHQSMSFKKVLSESVENVSALLLKAVDHVAASTQPDLKKAQAGALLGDARQLARTLRRRRFDAVVTSPPYCNRMSYIRELRPYMYWLGHLDVPSSAGELDWRAIGGTWGVATSRLNHWQAEQRSSLSPELLKLTAKIGEKSQLLRRYVERYFCDMAEHLASLSQVLERGARLSYVIGNSKFYDVLLPTEQLLGEQMQRCGFRSVDVVTLRTRTSKSELYEYLVNARKP